jgi:hypothetical protein
MKKKTRKKSSVIAQAEVASSAGTEAIVKVEMGAPLGGNAEAEAEAPAKVQSMRGEGANNEVQGVKRVRRKRSILVASGQDPADAKASAIVPASSAGVSTPVVEPVVVAVVELWPPDVGQVVAAKQGANLDGVAIFALATVLSKRELGGARALYEVQFSSDGKKQWLDFASTLRRTTDSEVVASLKEAGSDGKMGVIGGSADTAERVQEDDVWMPSAEDKRAQERSKERRGSGKAPPPSGNEGKERLSQRPVPRKRVANPTSNAGWIKCRQAVLEGGGTGGLFGRFWCTCTDDRLRVFRLPEDAESNSPLATIELVDVTVIADDESAPSPNANGFELVSADEMWMLTAADDIDEETWLAAIRFRQREAQRRVDREEAERQSEEEAVEAAEAAAAAAAKEEETVEVWSAHMDPSSGKVYYYLRESGTTSFELPTKEERGVAIRIKKDAALMAHEKREAIRMNTLLQQDPSGRQVALAEQQRRSTTASARGISVRRPSMRLKTSTYGNARMEGLLFARRIGHRATAHSQADLQVEQAKNVNGMCWFELREETVHVYSNKGKVSELACMDLAEFKLDASGDAGQGQQGGQTMFVLQHVGPAAQADPDCWMLCADCAEARQQWVAVLSTVCGHRVNVNENDHYGVPFAALAGTSSSVSLSMDSFDPSSSMRGKLRKKSGFAGANPMMRKSGGGALNAAATSGDDGAFAGLNPMVAGGGQVGDSGQPSSSIESRGRGGTMGQLGHLVGMEVPEGNGKCYALAVIQSDASRPCCSLPCHISPPLCFYCAHSPPAFFSSPADQEDESTGGAVRPDGGSIGQMVSKPCLMLHVCH